jgi:nicotinate-nucleotide pyrophosphorylase (carboxylating)
MHQHLKTDIERSVRMALEEDIGSGDITASLIPLHQQANAHIITRENAIFCGRDWVNEVLYQVDRAINIEWLVNDGEPILANQLLCNLNGPAQSLLTAERCALNYLQSLSGTATTAHYFARLIAGTGVKLLDTRKTIPGLRKAQKYAVTCGQCFNHRLGLYDAFLIKENHIAAFGCISAVVKAAREYAPGKSVEVEVENLAELKAALAATADTIMLDNFTLHELYEAVALNAGRAKLEASGGITTQNLRSIAQTGVDYISIGALTKDCRAIDLSMQFH